MIGHSGRCLAVALALAAGLSETVLAQETTEPVAYGSTCSGLTGVRFGRLMAAYTIRVPDGNFVPPGTGTTTSAGVPPYNTLAEFCRVTLARVPPSESPHRMEVWLPSKTWNGRLQVVGQSDDAGNVNYRALAAALARGAAAATLEGRTNLPPEVWHEFTVAAKGLLVAFFGQGPRRSYWSGCGPGGSPGLEIAAGFSDDFDGVLIGAPRSGPTSSLERFTATGGRLIIYAGAADLATPPAETVDFYIRLDRALATPQRAALRFFLLPRVRRCDVQRPEEGALLTALEQWVERGVAADAVLVPDPAGGAATAESSQLLCPYPRFAVYKGTGRRDDVRNFACNSK